MRRVRAILEDEVLVIGIPVASYGEAGKHWKEKLSGRSLARFGTIYLERSGADDRRSIHTWSMRGMYKGTGLDQDEAPGAMFIWTGIEPASVRHVPRSENRSLGSDMGRAVRELLRDDPPENLREVRFVFD